VPVNEWLVAIVIDTNIWISALINPHGAPARLIREVLSGRVRLIVSRQLLAEVEAVVRRDRIRRRIAFDDGEIENFFRLISKGARVANIGGSLRMCRDPKDDLILETAIIGRARYLVSRDEDLARDLDLVDALRGYGIEVVTVARFMEHLDADIP
jgi:putative PIN family toxin of toxin-antitoxin system